MFPEDVMILAVIGGLGLVLFAGVFAWARHKEKLIKTVEHFS